MYDKTARLYDLLYERGVGADYDAGAAAIAELIPGAASLLDVACGTGQHLQRLRARYDCTGIDLDPVMVEVARERCPGVPIDVADMTAFDLGRTFDAVICMFSSIGYARTEDRLRAAVACMARHLNPGGTLLVEPWLQRGILEHGRVSLTQAEADGIKVVRMSHMDVRPQESVITFAYLIGTSDGIEHATETHVLGLFTWDQYRDAFELAGLDTIVQTEGGPTGRGYLIGRRVRP